jgi:hypothetical protein
MDLPNALDDQVRRGSLQDNPRASELHRLNVLVAILGSRQDQNARTEARLLNCLQSRDAVQFRHLEVEH